MLKSDRSLGLGSGLPESLSRAAGAKRKQPEAASASSQRPKKRQRQQRQQREEGKRRVSDEAEEEGGEEEGEEEEEEEALDDVERQWLQKVGSGPRQVVSGMAPVTNAALSTKTQRAPAVESAGAAAAAAAAVDADEVPVFQLGEPDPVRRACLELEEEEAEHARLYGDSDDDDSDDDDGDGSGDERKGGDRRRRRPRRERDWCFLCKCTKSEIDMSQNEYYGDLLEYINVNLSQADLKSLAGDIQTIYERLLRDSISDRKNRRTWKKSVILKHLFEHTLNPRNELERDVRGLRELQAAVYRECINPNANCKALDTYTKLAKLKMSLLSQMNNHRGR